MKTSNHISVREKHYKLDPYSLSPSKRLTWIIDKLQEQNIQNEKNYIFHPYSCTVEETLQYELQHYAFVSVCVYIHYFVKLVIYPFKKQAPSSYSRALQGKTPLMT